MAEEAVFNDVRECIADGQLLAAIDVLDGWLGRNQARLRPGRLQDWRTELIVHKSGVRRIESEARRGTITAEQLRIEILKISESILRLSHLIEQAS